MDQSCNSKDFSGGGAVGPDADQPLSPEEKAEEYDQLVLQNQALKVRLRKARDELSVCKDHQVSISIQPVIFQTSPPTSDASQSSSEKSCHDKTANSNKIVDAAVAVASLDRVMMKLRTQSTQPFPRFSAVQFKDFLCELKMEVGNAQATIQTASRVPAAEKLLDQVTRERDRAHENLNTSSKAIKDLEKELADTKTKLESSRALVAFFQTRSTSSVSVQPVARSDIETNLALKNARDKVADLEKQLKEKLRQPEQMTIDLKDRESTTSASTAATGKICQLEAELKTIKEERDATILKETFGLRQDLIQETMRGDRLAEESAEHQKTIGHLTVQLEDCQDIISAFQSIDEEHQQSERRPVVKEQKPVGNRGFVPGGQTALSEGSRRQTFDYKNGM